VLGFIGGRTDQGGESFVNGDIDTLLASAFEPVVTFASDSVTGCSEAGKLLFAMNPATPSARPLSPRNVKSNATFASKFRQSAGQRHPRFRIDRRDPVSQSPDRCANFSTASA
jgi:hypothetical protein